ncbi:MAG: HAMP domain-containing histidine kinase, partial [Leptospiraceae bacterium]|nr:HAMP domain-containing histidine kinase [Leptospiraceae bacterium]
EHIAKLAETSVERALASGVYVHTEYFLPDKNGNPHYFELRCVKINNHEVMMIIRDITYTKLAKEEITSAQETLYKLSLLAPGIFYTYKFKPEEVSEFLYVSPSISQMIQIHAKDVLNDAKIAFDTIYEEDLHYFTEQMMNSYKTLSPFQVEYRLAYDLNRHMNVTAVPEREKDGSVIWYGFITETTEQKRQLKEMKRTTDLVAMQNKRLLEFTYIVSHNLRSHAANLKGISDLLSEPTNESELQSYHEMLNSSVENLMTTLEHLNMIVKIQGETNLAVQKINLYDSINSTMESLQIMINSIGVEIDNRVPENFTIYFIFAYMESILLNLISNAIKYREPSRKLKITISAENVADGVWLYVADNGQGIDLERVGERMFGMYQVFHDHPESRGLGLFLCRNHMESVGGRIEVDSTPGQGATFKLFFPSGQ